MNKDNNEDLNEKRNSGKAIKDKNLFKSFVMSMMFVFLIFVSNISFAQEVPIFNPQDKNPKPGLYRLKAPAVELGTCFTSEFLDPSNVLFYNYISLKHHGESCAKKIYVFNIETFKILEIKKISNYLKKNCLLIQDVFVSDNNKILISLVGHRGERLNYREVMEYDFNTNLYKIFQVPDSKGYCSIYKIDQDNICLLCEAYISYYSTKTRTYTNIFNMSEQKITAKYSEKSEEEKYYRNLLRELYKQQEKKGGLSSNNIPIFKVDHPKDLKKDAHLAKFLNNNKSRYPDKVTIVSRGEIDYGVSVNKFLGVYEDCVTYSSWFSPIYEYNISTQKLKPKNEFMRSFGSEYFKLKNKNMILIIGGTNSYYWGCINADPKDVAYRARVNHHAPYTKYVYIYVYDNE